MIILTIFYCNNVLSYVIYEHKHDFYLYIKSKVATYLRLHEMKYGNPYIVDGNIDLCKAPFINHFLQT